MYNFIHDIEELRRFYEIIAPPLKDFEVYFLSLSCRKKYLSEEDREKYHITRAEMFDRKLVRLREWDRFLRIIRKYEVAEGGYITKNGLPVPQKCMVIYYNINPSHSIKALQEFQHKIVDWEFEITAGNREGFSRKFNKLDIELMNCYQRCRGTKHWVDIDIDIEKNNEFELGLHSQFVGFPDFRYVLVDTKSGYHLMIRRDSLRFDPNDLIRRVDEYAADCCLGIKEVAVNKNEMIPLPGTFQGEYPVRVLWEQSRLE
jgi:hypothetical protein